MLVRSRAAHTQQAARLDLRNGASRPQRTMFPAPARASPVMILRTARKTNPFSLRSPAMTFATSRSTVPPAPKPPKRGSRVDLEEMRRVFDAQEEQLDDLDTHAFDEAKPAAKPSGAKTTARRRRDEDEDELEGERAQSSGPLAQADEDGGEQQELPEAEYQRLAQAYFEAWLKRSVPPEDFARIAKSETELEQWQEKFEQLVIEKKITTAELETLSREINPALGLMMDHKQELSDLAADVATNNVGNIEQSFTTEEEAQKAPFPTIRFGNKWVPINYYIRLKQKEFAGFFPEGFSGSISHIVMNNRRSFMVRFPALAAVEQLSAQRAARFAGGPSAHFLVGEPGVGKSSVLSTLVYWARKDGWLVVYIPSGFNFVNDGNLQRSRREPLHFDQPEVAMPFLDTFAKGNRHIISQLPLRTPFTIGEFSSAGKTMLDLAEWGKESFEFSCDAVFHLRQELSLVTEFPVMIAIDDFNLLHEPAQDLYDPDFVKLHPPRIDPAKLTLSRNFMNWQTHGLMNGTMVCAMTNSLPRNTKAFDKKFPKLPSKILVPRFTLSEFSVLMAHYQQNKYLTTEMNDQTAKYVYHMCSGRGREIFKFLAIY